MLLVSTLTVAYSYTPFGSVMLSPPRRTKHLALLLLGRKVQSEILRFAQNDSEVLRITAGKRFFRRLLSLERR